MVQPAEPMWFCQAFPACDTYVRCHPGSTAPMGTLAGPRLRKLRGNAHKAFDPLWQEGGKVIGRAMAYLVAGRVMCVEDFHIGHLDEGGCLQLLASIGKIEDALLEQAEQLLHPRAGLSDPELDVLEAIFSEDYGQTWLARIPSGELTKIGPIAEQALAAGITVIEEGEDHRRWAVLTAKGRSVLARSAR